MAQLTSRSTVECIDLSDDEDLAVAGPVHNKSSTMNATAHVEITGTRPLNINFEALGCEMPARVVQHQPQLTPNRLRPNLSANELATLASLTNGIGTQALQKALLAQFQRSRAAPQAHASNGSPRGLKRPSTSIMAGMTTPKISRPPLMNRHINNGSPSISSGHSHGHSHAHASIMRSLSAQRPTGIQARPQVLSQPNYRLPPNLVTNSQQQVPPSRLVNYNFEAKFGKFEKGLEIAEGKFKCTFNRCNKVIHGNVSFVCHLWAHASEVLPLESLDEFRNRSRLPCKISSTSVRGISMCLQCLGRFTTPNKMQVHYTRCHSRVPQSTNSVACSICEIEVPNLRAHLSIHAADEAPYVCQASRCNYRATQRMALFDHYVDAHRDTVLLWCPFCTYSETVSRAQLRAKVTITSNTFVSHVTHHFIGRAVGTIGATVQRFPCNRCAYNFLTERDLVIHYRDDHAPVSKSWAREAKPAAAFQHRKIGALVMKGVKTDLCEKCRLIGHRVKKCVDCLQNAYELSMRYQRPTAAGYYIFRKGWDKYQDGRRLLSCACGYKTRSGTQMARHRFDFCAGEELLGLTVEEASGEQLDVTEVDKQADAREAEIFSVVFPIEIARVSNEPHGNQKHVDELDKIRDEFCDVDDDEMLVMKQMYIRATNNKASESMKLCRSILSDIE